MRCNFNITRVLFLCILAPLKPVDAAPIFIDASVDLTKLKIADKNAIGDGITDSTVPVQAGIDYLAKNTEGGSLIFGPGVYRIGGIVVKPHVKIVGAGQQQTTFRSASTSIMFDMKGGELHNFTAYGTPDATSSGNFWKVGKRMRGSSARTLHIIRVGNSPLLIAKDVIISNITAKESRSDCLYTRGSKNLRVLNSHFDRAGRNVLSMVGNDEDFLIAGCRFGSLWGLYHVDIEPNTGSYVRNGIFLNCVFDGRQAGEMNTDTWGAMLIFTGGDNLENSNVSIVGCNFHKINVRVRDVFPGVQFLYNPQMGKLFRVSSDLIGELRDATIRGNSFGTPQVPIENIASGVAFTGNTIFEDNIPAVANETKITTKKEVPPVEGIPNQN